MASGRRRITKKERERRAEVLRILDELFPEKIDTALQARNPYELLVATILSAQCTDRQVNKVTPALFEKYPTVQDLARANLPDVERIIHSTGFYRSKAKNIVNMAKEVVSRFGGKIPETMEELVTLPGVGRKTAGVLLGDWFDKAEGIVVDTHVFRVSRRLGLAGADTPQKVEKELMELLPRDKWIQFSHRLIKLGRTVCSARKPKCHECALHDVCPSALEAP